MVGLVITAAILGIVWQSGKAVFVRLLGGVAPETVDEIRRAAGGVEGVGDVSEVRTWWLGHRLRAEVHVAVPAGLSVAEGHAVAREVGNRLTHELRYLDAPVVDVDPLEESGEEHHRVRGPRRSPARQISVRTPALGRSQVVGDPGRIGGLEGRTAGPVCV